jgi:catechol 2,3-dioxygenase-like lactoylglutathione lyase family enzyme
MFGGANTVKPHSVQTLTFIWARRPIAVPQQVDISSFKTEEDSVKRILYLRRDPRYTAASSSHLAGHSAETPMAKIRHIAIQVPDLEKAAAFYENVFELKRVAKVEAPIGNAISLSDGVMNLTLLHFPEGTKGGKGGPDWAGLHHFGFVVDDEQVTAEKIKSHGGEFFMKLPQYPGVDAEMKFKDINGIVFDVSEHDWRQAKDS